VQFVHLWPSNTGFLAFLTHLANIRYFTWHVNASVSSCYFWVIFISPGGEEKTFLTWLNFFLTVRLIGWLLFVINTEFTQINHVWMNHPWNNHPAFPMNRDLRCHLATGHSHWTRHCQDTQGKIQLTVGREIAAATQSCRWQMEGTRLLDSESVHQSSHWAPFDCQQGSLRCGWRPGRERPGLAASWKYLVGVVIYSYIRVLTKKQGTASPLKFITRINHDGLIIYQLPPPIKIFQNQSR